MLTINDEDRIEVSDRMNGTSNVAILDERAIAAAMPAPNVANLNVTKSSKVHIGPKFVSVTQNVQNAEMIKGRFLGLELVSSKRARRLRCCVVVFISWALIVTIGLMIYIIYVTQPTQMRLDIGLNETWYLRRVDWDAMPSRHDDYLNLPVENVIIGHSAANYCIQRNICIDQMRIIQQYHFRSNWNDIGPNFLVAGNGDIFEGRGANILGTMIRGMNGRSISIMFIGNYVVNQTDPLQFEHTQILVDRLVEIGVLRPDYVLRGQCQIEELTIPPGPNVMNKMSFFPHWDPKGLNACMPG
ncbi:peptidoglycan-recognition protein SC2-like [Melitaea cinxia]|uniref:peptidoglycan-recognition protein SC2-like n=1 Tax=Melitaea cinxia TaxID=113334 RepID=UPI001E27310D|nr:peptidoglycan-recognition protein SC2-like [Melitaea cinxia]